SVCPNDALYFGFGKPSILVPKSDAIKSNYSLTWPEEIVGALVFLGSLHAGSIFDGFRLRYGHDVSHLENVALVPRKRIVLLPFQFEISGQNSKSGLGVCNL